MKSVYRGCRRYLLVAAFAALALGAAPAAASASGFSASLTNDANHDGTFSVTENVAKNVTYPWTVTFHLSITSGPAGGPGGAYHTIASITDTAGADLSGCQGLIGQRVPVGNTVGCDLTLTIASAQSSPLSETVKVSFDGGGGDVLHPTSTVNFPGMSLSKSSTTAWVYYAGQVVPYSYVVTNTGTSTLSGVALADNNTDAAPSCPSSTLAVGASETCTAQHTVTAADLAAGGNLTNLATASSNEAPDAPATYSIPIAQTPAGGNFVIGDLNSAVGTNVTFWGAQWWKLNSLSGGSAPAAFKGFEDQPALPACGQNWTTDPGNSTPPPAGPLPPFMVIIVSSQITKSGSTIAGDTPHLVVVSTNPGYAGNPGHAGTGTVVATLC